MPTRDEMADYLETYVHRFRLPVRTRVSVLGIARADETYEISTTGGRLEATNVIVATGAHRQPRVPALARELDPQIVQLHSSQYRDPSQLRPGGVLVVGAGNSGADIALDAAAAGHQTWLSGPDRGHLPFDIDSWISRNIAVRLVVFAGRHVLTLRTPIGRKAKAQILSRGMMLIRTKPEQLTSAGIERVLRTTGVRDGSPVVEDGGALDVTNVIWCTGFRHDLSWIDLPIFGEDGAPAHERGVVVTEQGLYLVGLPFQFAVASDVLPGVGRDARYVVKQLVRRSRAPRAMADLAA
jgi:putative flavoprotein involved in K+ transport